MDALRIVASNNFSEVTTNMFAYHYLPDGKEENDQILVVDCGIGFPERGTLGVDLVIPDFTYLLKRKDKIRAIVLTHGHQDHIGALSFLLPDLPKKVSVFGSKLAAAMVKDKLNESGVQANVKEFTPEQQIRAGKFKVSAARVTHSLPDCYHLLIETPAGNFYHGTDFKFDLTPPDGIQPELGRIAAFGKKNIRCLLSDCLGAEKKGHSPSERILNEVFEEEIHQAKGRVFVTAISSNVYRWQAAVNASKKYGRKIALVGMSIQKNVEIARKLGYLKNLNDQDLVDYYKALKMPDDKVTYLIAGSLGQAGSSLSRVVLGKHKIKVKKEDKFIFSSPDYVPGTSDAVLRLINQLIKLKAEVVYEELGETLHVSGHGSQQELAMLANLVAPEYYLPIGGEARHAFQYKALINKMGENADNVLLPKENKMPTFWENGKVDFSYQYQARRVLIDGLGIGDVGETVLRDRRILSKDGMIVLILNIDSETKELIEGATVASRGFVYMKESKKLLGKIEKVAAKSYNKAREPVYDFNNIRYQVQGELEEYVKQETGREPIILPVLLEI